MFDELLTPPPSVDYPASEVVALIHEVVAPVPAVSTGSPSSTNVDQDAPSPSHSQTTPKTQPPIIPNDVEEDNHDIEIAHMGNDPYFGIPIPEIPSDQSSSSDSIHTIVHPDHQISKHNSKWTKDHPLENIIGELDRPVSTRLQLHEQALSLFLLIRSFPSVPFLSTPSSSPPPRRGNKGEIRGGIRGLGARERDKRELIRGWKESFALVSDCAGYKDFSPGIIQPDDFVDPDNPNHVYKLKKALYGLKQAYCRGSDEDKKRKSAVLNPSHYVTWIGTLLISQLVDLDATISLYARVERPGCARGESDADHDGLSDNAVAHLERYSQRDYGDRLVSWSSKRQKSATISSTKAKYIAMSGCCAQISVIGVIGESAARARALSGDNTRAQQKALDDELVALADRLKIGKRNLRLSSILKSKEPTLQVDLDALKLTPFYNAFKISADVPKYTCKSFWVPPLSHRHHSLTSYLKENHPIEEEILSFIRDLGHTGEIKFLFDVNVNHMQQPWRLFASIINKCRSGKTTALESLRLSRAQILWGMYHNKTVDYVYLLWEDLVYQVENKNSKKNNDMDDFMFTTIRVISKHQDTQVYGAILPQHLTNQAMLESEAYMTYHAYATGEKTPKPKSTKKKADSESSPKTKLTQASKGKRIKTVAKGDKPAKKKQSVTKSKGLTLLSEVALTEAEQIKLAIKRSLIQTHSSHASGSGVDEGTDDDADNQDDEIPDDANQDDDDEQTDLDNDGDDFVHPKISTHDDEARQDEEESDKESDDESNKDSDEEVQGANIKEEEMDKEATHEEDESNELYRDVTEDTHVIITASMNPEGQQQSSFVSSGFISNMLNPSPDTGIDTIFTPNTEATSLVDVPVTTIAEPPLLSATTLPPTPLITHLQQTPVPTPATVPSSSLQDLPNFGSLFGFDHRLKTLETDFSEFKQTNQFAKAVSSIPGIVDAYLANKMHEAVKTAVQLQSERLRDEAQAENADFLNKLDDNIKKIIKDQVKEQVKAQISKILPKIKKTVNEQLEIEVLTPLSNKSKTSYVVAAILSKLELKKILIDKMENNKSIHRSDKQRNLYKALVDAYESDKFILDTYGDTVSFKRQLESTSTPKKKTSKTTGKSTEGSKSHHKSAGESTQAEEPMHTAKDLEEPLHQEFKTGVTEDQPNEETFQHPDCSLAQMEDPCESFNELMDTPLDFSAFVMNRLKVDTLTPELLAGPTFKLMKGSCKSLYLDWITVRRDDDKLYKFKEGDFNRLHIQDIEDISVVIQRRMEDLQLGVKSYQKKLNLTKPDTYRSDLKRREAYTAYSNPRGFIYQNKYKKNRLMRIDELHKFSDGTLNDVRTALDDRLKGIRMKYLPQTIWRQSDRDKAGAMIQAIDKQLKTRRIMRSLEKFVGGRPYEGDFRLLQRTI
ncbi:hypothetical protein Tco_0549463 [Tanacetum coccineum]